MKTWDGKFIGGEYPGTREEETASAAAILQRIFEHACGVLERRMHMEDTALTLTQDDFLIIQRYYDLPDHPKIVLGVPLLIAHTKEPVPTTAP